MGILEFEISVDDLDCAVIPAHRAPVCICRHAFAANPACPLRVHCDTKLAFPVKIAACMTHLEVGSPGLFQFHHIADMGGDA